MSIIEKKKLIDICIQNPSEENNKALLNAFAKGTGNTKLGILNFLDKYQFNLSDFQVEALNNLLKDQSCKTTPSR